jgi:uncharacterized iron-regulated membrane protein
MKRARRWWLYLHLCVGLALGAVFVLLGVTGSLLVFYPELDRTLNPALRPSAPAVQIVSIQSVAHQLRMLYPERNGGWRIELPLNDGTPITARYAQPTEREGRSFSPLMVTLDPATLKRTSDRVWGDYLVTWIYDLHYSLLSDTAGKSVVGVIGLFMLLSILSGLYLWWPSILRWRAALKPVLREGTVRRTYDLHTLSGIYGAALVIVLAITGTGLAFPNQTRSLLDGILGVKSVNDVATYRLADGAILINLDDAVAIAHELFPQAYLRWVDVPAIGEGPISIRLHQPGEPSFRFPKTRLWVDPQSKEILSIRDPKQNAAGNTVLDWLHPLHNGEAFGPTGRWLAFISGFLPLLLFVTGFIRWRQKQKSKSKQRAKLLA